MNRDKIIRDMDLLLRNELTGEWTPGQSRWKKDQNRRRTKVRALLVLIVAVLVAVVINNLP